MCYLHEVFYSRKALYTFRIEYIIRIEEVDEYMPNEHPRQGRPYLITRSLAPAENQEHPVHFVRQPVTPNDVTYRRNHFPYPALSTLTESFTIE
jgi:hypothetical protein